MGGRSSGGNARTDLDRTICRLVARGHSGVLAYPWALYLAAIQVANEDGKA